MPGRWRPTGRSIAQALFALLVGFGVAGNAAAACNCECPECPKNDCAIAGCAVLRDGVRCSVISSGECPGLDARADNAPPPRDISPTTWVEGVAITSLLVLAGSDDASAPRRALSPPYAAVPAYIAFCRLLR